MALAKGDRGAAIKLGNLFLDGEIVGTDPARAATYYEQNMQGVPQKALLRLGDIFRDGKLVEADGRKAIYLYEKALAQGDLKAATRLGDVYLDGVGVPAAPVRLRPGSACDTMGRTNIRLQEAPVVAPAHDVDELVDRFERTIAHDDEDTRRCSRPSCIWRRRRWRAGSCICWRSRPLPRRTPMRRCSAR